MKCTPQRLLVLLLCAASHHHAFAWSAPEPFGPLSAAANSAGLPPRPAADDPLVRYTWPAGTNASALQIYRVGGATAATATPPAAFSGVPSLVLGGGPVAVTVHGGGAIQLDFGVERAAWSDSRPPWTVPLCQ